MAMSALRGVRVIELAGLAPVPYAGMILADFGADVIRIDRPAPGYPDVLARGKKSLVANLKDPRGVEVVARLAESADVLLEPFRPGVMEKLGLGPDVLMAANPKLVYARLTGFGQTGPSSAAAGHDINYLAASGLLASLARKGERPLPPVNLLADFAGGGMACAMGVLLALLERQGSGKGQIVDAAMMDGAAYLGSMIFNFRNMGLWRDDAGTNMLDSAAPFYDTYTTKDGLHVAVGAIEPQFYAAMLDGMGLDPADLPAQMDQDEWPAMKAKFADVFASKTRAEWAAVFDGVDACVNPVLTLAEVADDPHVKARKIFAPAADGVGLQATPAPKLSRTPGEMTPRPSPIKGQHTVQVMREAGFGQPEIDALLADDIVVQLEDDDMPEHDTAGFTTSKL